MKFRNTRSGKLQRLYPVTAGAVRYFSRLASGDFHSWKTLPYQLSMFCRGIQLTGVTACEIGLSDERSAGYRDSGGPALRQVLRTLPISQSDVALDIGCGKGGAMLTLALCPFARVDGVELSPQLAQIARQNLERLGVHNANVFCCDAAEFTDLDAYTYFYMYHPFPEIVMRPVMENICSSMNRRPRNLFLIYKNPVLDALVISVGFRKLGDILPSHVTDRPFALYTWTTKSNAC